MNKRLSGRSIYRRLRYLLFLLLFTIISLEILLRIYYPFPTRIRGDRLELSTNLSYSIRNRNFRGIDSVIVYKKTLPVDDHSVPGSWKLFWYELQPYNEMTKDVARRRSIPCIDLAAEMPADTSYYYDMLHFNSRGADKVAEIVYRDLTPWIDSHFPDFRKEK